MFFAPKFSTTPIKLSSSVELIWQPNFNSSSEPVSYKLKHKEDEFRTWTISDNLSERKFFIVPIHLVMREVASTLVYSNRTGETTFLDVREGDGEPGDGQGILKF